MQKVLQKFMQVKLWKDNTSLYIQCPVQPPPAACRKADILLPPLWFFRVADYFRPVAIQNCIAVNWSPQAFDWMHCVLYVHKAGKPTKALVFSNSVMVGLGLV